ncbi:TlpA family protein disulfide reductase [Bacillus sp. FJAT-49705]|uniref:TlpA family protein disulfide reductase n=1 Tax=Cytobacillus citreus TaxID=2833586 RepID=A0ABS5NPA7_9BACI|nr:TlpA disulfide reductase family protein [Cytobacillus citreus]MBS4189411.1 TlpA family protein disulfide reductase [Cytobacillus citreus]
MIKKIFAAIVLFGLMTVAIVQAMEKEEPKPKNDDRLSGLSVGLKAPDFELKNLKGETVKLSDYKGQKVMLNFWATWCPPCKAEMPDMQKFYTESGDNIAILAINIDPEYDVAGFAKELGLDFTILLDDQDKVNTVYKILTIPTTFFIDENGIITHKHLSSMSIETMRKYAGL